MLEKKHQPLASRKRYFKRLFKCILFGLFFILLAEYIGMLGYHYFEHLNWVDSFVNAAMILSSMGPMSPLQTTAGKIFAGMYALFSGIAFILIIGIIFTPVVHRLFHKFHVN